MYKVGQSMYLSCPIWNATPVFAYLPNNLLPETVTCLVQVHLESEVLVTFEHRIFHDLPNDIFQLMSPEVEILVTIL